MTITVALGTSTPTSITEVATSIWASPDLNWRIDSSLSAGFILPWQIAVTYCGSGKSREMAS